MNLGESLQNSKGKLIKFFQGRAAKMNHKANVNERENTFYILFLSYFINYQKVKPILVGAYLIQRKKVIHSIFRVSLSRFCDNITFSERPG